MAKRYTPFTKVMECRKRGRTTTYRDVELGRLPKPIKIGGRLYFDEDELAAKDAELSESRN